MTRGFQIGRILGFDLRLNWSWAVVFLLIVWDLGAGLLPQRHPIWPAWMNWAMAAVAALLFFLSVLAHELSRLLAARAAGLYPHRTRLFIVGGVSNLDTEPQSPVSEFLSAIVAPVVSIAFGCALLVFGTASAGIELNLDDGLQRAFAQAGAVSSLLLWLGSMNLIVGLLNFAPGFPLAGGRVLRSILWAVTGDLQKAAWWTAGMGRFIAWLLMFGGVLAVLAMAFGIPFPYFGTRVSGGFLLTVIGWSLNNAARETYQQVLTRHLLGEIPVYRLVRLQVPAVPPELRVSKLVREWLMGRDEAVIPVLDQGRMLGLVSLSDINKVKDDSWETAVVGEIMTPTEELQILTPGEDLSQALDILSSRDLRQAPVVENGRLVGMLRRRDIVNLLQHS